MKKTLMMSFLVSAAMMMDSTAEGLPTPVLAIVEQATLDQSSAFKDIVKQIEQKRAEIQKELATYETELKAQDKKLAEEQKTLPEKEFNDKRQVFEKRVKEIQEKIEIRRAQLELGVEEAKKKVFEAFLKVADDVMKEVGANIMLYKETVVTADKAFDLTTQVLEKLNQSLPKVQVSFKSEADVKKQLQQQPQ
ncbi:MAG: OmpH family outer membrane protein [Alphaproteobacteria bacterium]|nr:OmpH family outer membrane protein [Alphaproteobacteria bacterium]